MKKKSLSGRQILSRKPAEYLKQGLSHCGAYSVKGILSAFGEDIHEHPKYYHPSLLGRLTGMTMSDVYWVEVLRSYGLKATLRRLKSMSDIEKLEFIKQALAQNNIVMLRVGNGYLPTNGNYKLLLGAMVGHWVTLWGYDEAKKCFYVYDSAVPKRLYDSDILVGNKKRTYKEVLRDMNRQGLFPWLRGSLCIEVSSN